MDWSLISKVLLPEAILVIGILLTLMMSLFDSTKKHNAGISVVFLGLAAIACLKQFFPDESQSVLFNSFVNDGLSLFFRFLIYSVTALIVMGSQKYLSVLESPAEYYPIIMTAALGGGMLTGANDLLFFFVALETLGLSAIILAAYARLNQKSNEAGIKYLINSAAATAILLLGLSFLYGITGFTNFDEVALRLYHLNVMSVISSPLIILIAVCLVGSTAFKLAAAPFQNWSPDVYTGAPITTTVFLSVVSKTAALGLAIRLFNLVFNYEIVSILFAIIAMLSVVVGNYIGMIQMISRGSIKRLLAYSSIAQAGYLLIGLAVMQPQSLSALVFYLTVYALMNTGAFLCATYFESATNSDEIFDLSGLIQKRPAITIAFSLCLINLAGLPFVPAAFIAKFYLFNSAFTSGLSYGPILAIVGLVGSIIALFYYLYLVKIMVVDEPSTAVKQIEEPVSPALAFSTGIVVTMMLGFGIFGMGIFKDLASTVISNIAG